MIAALVAAVAAVAGTVINNQANKKRQREANEANVANQQAMWEQTNEYNDPTNQMMRLQKAGLNPNLVYGSGAPYNTAQNQNMPDMKNYETQNPFENLPSAVTDYNNVRQQEKRISNETLVATTNALNTAQDTANKKIQGAKSEFDLEQGRRLADNAFNIQEQQLANLRADEVRKNIDNMNLPDQYKKIMEEANTRMMLMGEQMSTEQKRREMLNLEIELKKAGLENAPWYSRWFMRNYQDAKEGVKNYINRNGGLPIKF